MALVPRPHQADAAQAVLSALASRRRATLVMPCATGKTLVQLMVASRFRRVLCLEPSLALIRQTLQRAREEGLLEDRALLCVCSDDGVARDAWRVDEAELGVPVTTDPAEIKRVLRDGMAGAIVFCTYQSLPLLAEGLPAGFEFELGIFDECHRTAGPIGKRFAIGLTDACMPIQRRMFATATPKVLSAPEEQESELQANSMDDAETYGDIVYRMSVREAIAKELICDYQVLVSATTESAAREAMVRAKDLILPQGEVPVELVGAQLSVIRAMQQCGARRVVTYHSTIADAQDFAGDTLGLFEEAGIATFHIFGAMPSRQRSAVIEAFLACSGPALISNARCLTEGVDVPAIDLVALVSKRESLGDVVQILGRALRPFPGKETGYVMLPLFVDATIAPEQALSQSDLAVTWEILHTILETDDDPTDFRTMRTGVEGGARGASASRGKLRVVASDDVLPALERGIVVRSVVRLAHERDTMMKALAEYCAREGHARVPRTHVEGHYRLGAWLRRMRKLRAGGRLDPMLESELAKLGVEFGTKVHDDEQRLDELEDYYRRRNTWAVPRKTPWSALALYVAQLRKDARDGSLAPTVRGRLEKMGFPLDRHEQSWARRLASLKTAIMGAESLEAAWGKVEDLDRRWLRRTQKRRRAGRLSEGQAEELRKLGVDLSAELPADRHEHLPRLKGEESFARNLRALSDHLTGKESPVVDRDVRHDGVNVWEFVNRCRKLFRRGALSTSQIERLDATGAHWRPPSDIARDYMVRLKEFKEQHGHMRLPTSKEYKRLRNFVQSQRKNRAKLPAERIRELEAIGFTWDLATDTWQKHLHAMQRARANGEDPFAGAQGEYLRGLQRKHRAGQLSDEKLSALAELGLPWARVNGEETAMIARLARLARTFGKVNVETMMKREKDLQSWVHAQRVRAADGTIDSATEESLKRYGVKLGANEKKKSEHKASGS
jgi:superfamily II DNA or RNA helicase